MTKLEMAKNMHLKMGNVFLICKCKNVLPVYNGYLLAVTENKRQTLLEGGQRAKLFAYAYVKKTSYFQVGRYFLP